MGTRNPSGMSVDRAPTRAPRASLANASALAALLVLPLVGCSGEDPGAPHRTESGVCVDADGDGFGSNCGGGADCDDTNPAVTDDCRCAEPVPGCSCPVQGERVDCGMVEVQVGAQTVCGFGQMVCDQGAWGPCIINNAVPAASAGVSLPASGTAVLGGPEVCAGSPCDPRCNTWPDDPTGLGDPNAGLEECPGGLTLIGTPYVDPSGCTGGGGPCVHHVCETGAPLDPSCDAQPGPTPGCVSKVCAAKPECCDPAGLWDTACVNLIPSTCDMLCGEVDGTCTLCYKDTQDHDGDGFSFSQGDCMDCDPDVNPSAYDYPYNGADEDCSGVPDDEVMTCDEALTLSPDPVAQIQSYLSAIELCQTTTTGGPGWGVLPGASFVRANAWPNGGGPLPHPSGYGILPQYGQNNHPRAGDRLLSISSGAARNPGDPQYVAPTLPPSGLVIPGDLVPYPAGFPQAGHDANGNPCPLPNDAGPSARDSVGLWFKLRAPSNARSFSFDFDFFSAEYFTELCTDHNDTFATFVTNSALPVDPVHGNNVAFDAGGNPISVNNTFFTIPGGVHVWNHPALLGTGFDEDYQTAWHLAPKYDHPPGTCFSGVCGGATDWLTTTVPTLPGDTVTVMFAVWDQKFHTRDAVVLIDNWRWSTDPASVETLPAGPPPSNTETYAPGTLQRDYDASGLCGLGEVPFWGLWSWDTQTPSDSRVRFYVQTAPSLAELDFAPVDPLEFSNPPWPTSPLTGSCSPAPCTGGIPATAASAYAVGAGFFDTQGGSTLVDATLASLGRSRNDNAVRIWAVLEPSSDTFSAPILEGWNLEVSCVPSE
jgi:hypothetical protein